MVSDQEIANGVETLLRQSDPNAVTTLNGVVEELGVKLGQDLTHKAAFIRDHINLLFRSHPKPQPPPPPLQKDHFALQQQQQFQNASYQQQQFPSHFALLHHHHQQRLLQQQQQQRHMHDLNYSGSVSQSVQSQPPPPVRAHPPPPVQSRPPPPVQTTKKEDVSAQTAATSAMPKESAPAGTKRRGGPGGLNKLCGVSPELQAVVGAPALARTEIVKQLWAYIRKHNLQDPSNKRKIICDEALRVLFETDCTDMFKMNKLLSKHIISLGPKKEPAKSKRLKVDVEAKIETVEPPSPLLVVISEALFNFFGTGEREMLQSEALGRVWEYIKVNHLEDPLNAMVILCDEKLQELLGCESISALGISEMLARHHLYNRSS